MDPPTLHKPRTAVAYNVVTFASFRGREGGGSSTRRVFTLAGELKGIGRFYLKAPNYRLTKVLYFPVKINKMNFTK